MTRLQHLTALRDKVKAGDTPEAHEVVSAIGRDYDEGIACVSLVRWACDASDIRAMGAAKELHEALLPGISQYSIVTDPTCLRVTVAAWPDGLSAGNEIFGEAWGHEPARAWLLAILSALIAQEGGE